MHRRVSRLLLVALAAGALVAGAARPARSDQTVRLPGSAVQNLSLATFQGAVPASQPVTVGVFLSNPNQAAEDAYVKALYDPSSASYEQFLEPDQFAAQYGVPASSLQNAESWLQSKGLSTTEVEGATDLVLASGTASQVAAAFSTTLNRYAGQGRSFYANATPAQVPGALGIQSVTGLNDINRFMTPRVAATGIPNPSLLGPKDLWSIYDLPDSNRGLGQSMAIIGWGVTDPVIPDLRSFENEWGLPQVPVTEKEYGDTSTPDTSGDGATGEWELDTQASTGMAPDVSSEALYFAHHNTDTDTLAAIAGWANDRSAPKQASASFGECENVGNAAVAGTPLADGIEVPGDAILEQAVIEGRTLFSSTGDTGSSCPAVPVDTNGVATQGYPGLEWPSVSPWAVAVGGTDLTSDGGTPPKRLAETAWEFTGGGNSTSEPAGSYQQGVAPANCLFDKQGNPYVPGVAAGPICRSTPDVAAISGDVATGNGLSITNDSGSDQQGAGTSLSSPLWLGFWTRIQAAAKGKGLGFANYALYRIAQASPGRDFYDVTVGDNQPYPAKPGYDNVSGWGTPEVSQLMQDLTGRLTPTAKKAPTGPVATTPSTTCSDLFTDVSGDDSYAVEGQSLAAPGTSPQLDILSGKMALSADGQTLRTIITVKDLSTTIPTGGVENDYQFVWSLDGTTYFSQLAVLPDGSVQAYDGQLVKVSLENRYQQLHVDTGSITPGSNGTVEVDIPLANLPGVTTGSDLQQPSAATYVREGAVAGPLEPVDSAGPTNDYVAGGC
jgi:subtilase family serine protease